MTTNNDPHQQFAGFFPADTLGPFAYLSSRQLGEGHICLDLKDLQANPPELPARYLLHSNSIANLQSHKLVSKFPREDQPFVMQGDRLYLQRYFRL